MIKKPKIFIASVANETNTFSPLRTDIRDFKDSFYALPNQHPDTPTLCSAIFPVARKKITEKNWQLIEGLATWAEPGGVVNQQSWQYLRDTVLNQLKAALPVDAVLLGLHGAMVAQQCDDCEGELLEEIRALTGNKTIIGATLDPHSHLTPKRVTNADILIAFKEFPHTDFVDAAEQLLDITIQTLSGEINPVLSVFDCQMIDIFPTNQDPMRGFVNKLKQLEKAPLLSLSVIHGFMAGDVAHLGTKIIVVSDNAKDKGDKLAKQLGLELFSFRGKTSPKFVSPEKALDQALAAPKYPIVIADVWDNPGGGVPGDSTILLKLMLERNISHSALATIWDPIAVRICISAGEGAKLALRFGGKISAHGGSPIDALVTVTKIVHRAQQSFGISKVPLGDAVVITVDGIEVILNSIRSQAFSPDIFTNMGINPVKKNILVLKSTNHFFDAFSPIVADVIYTSIAGLYPNNPLTNGYTKASKNIWPFCNNPHKNNL